MPIIIKLQNLPWSASSLDVRQYFAGLSIPDGGVHIVGGEKGDVFIVFGTDEDARQAMKKDGGKIKDVQVKVLLSSRTEMKQVIDEACNSLNAQKTIAVSLTEVVHSASHQEKIVDHNSNSLSREREKSSQNKNNMRSFSSTDHTIKKSPSGGALDREKVPDRDHVDRTSGFGVQFNDFLSMNDKRKKLSYDSENNDSHPSKSVFHSKQQNQTSVNQACFDHRIPTKTTGNFYDNGDGVQIGEKLTSHSQPNVPPIQYEDLRQPIIPQFPSIGVENFHGGTLYNNTFPGDDFSKLNTCGNTSNIHGNESKFLTHEKQPDMNIHSLGKQTSCNPASGYVNDHSSRFSREAFSLGQPLSSTVAFPPKPSYDVKSHIAYEQPSALHQTGRGADCVAPKTSFKRSMLETKSDFIDQFVPLTGQSHTFHENVSHALLGARIPARFEEPPYLRQNEYRPECGSLNGRKPDLLVPPPLPSASNINLDQKNYYPEFLARDKISDFAFNRISPPVCVTSYDKCFSTVDISASGVSNRNISQRPFLTDYSRPPSGDLPDHRKPYTGSTYDRPTTCLFSEKNGSLPVTQKRKRNLSIDEPRNMRPLSNRIEPFSNRISHQPPLLTVEVRGLPFNACEADVLELFRDIYIPPENLKLQFDNCGHPTGTAFVKFLNQYDFENGLSRHRHYIGNSYPEVIACPAVVFENATVPNGPAYNRRHHAFPWSSQPHDENLCVQLHGLPHSCIYEDIARLFNGLEILHIMIDRAPDGYPVGTGFVKFATPHDVQAALRMNRKMIDHSYINVSVARKERMPSVHRKFFH